MTNVNTRLRTSSADEAALLAIDKKIRATHYPETKDQRAFLDRQARTIVSLRDMVHAMSTRLIGPSSSSAPNCGLLSPNEPLAKWSSRFAQRITPPPSIARPVSALSIPPSTVSRPTLLENAQTLPLVSSRTCPSSLILNVRPLLTLVIVLLPRPSCLLNALAIRSAALSISNNSACSLALRPKLFARSPQTLRITTACSLPTDHPLVMASTASQPGLYPSRVRAMICPC